MRHRPAHQAGPTRLARLAGLAVLAVLAMLAGLAAGCSSAPVTVVGGASAGGSGSLTAGTTMDRAVPAEVASLPLVNQDGDTVTLASLRGKTVVLTDFLTLCQEICPLTSAVFSTAQQQVAKAGLGDEVVFLEGTVDPDRDTPARLAAYQKLFGAQPNWQFLTGTAADLDALWKFFGVYHERQPEGSGPAPTDWLTGQPLTYDVAHQDVVVILGPDGNQKWLVNGTPNTAGVKPPPTLDAFLSSDGKQNLAHPADPSWTAGDIIAAISQVTGKQIG